MRESNVLNVVALGHWDSIGRRPNKREGDVCQISLTHRPTAYPPIKPQTSEMQIFSSTRLLCFVDRMGGGASFFT